VTIETREREIALDLCQTHLDELLRGARPIGP
jgi:hypothetical protein